MREGKFKFEVEKVAGGQSEGHFCGVFNKNVELGNGDSGLLVACIESEEAAKSHKIFEDTAERLEAWEGSILESLSPGQSETVGGGSSIFCFFYKDACYVSRIGSDVKLWIYESGQSGEIEIENGSGLISTGQVYLLANKKCLELFDFSVLAGVGYDIGDIADGMATEISTQGGDSIGAVLEILKNPAIERTKTGKIIKNTIRTKTGKRVITCALKRRMIFSPFSWDSKFIPRGLSAKVAKGFLVRRALGSTSTFYYSSKKLLPRLTFSQY